MSSDSLQPALLAETGGITARRPWARELPARDLKHWTLEKELSLQFAYLKPGVFVPQAILQSDTLYIGRELRGRYAFRDRHGYLAMQPL